MRLPRFRMYQRNGTFYAEDVATKSRRTCGQKVSRRPLFFSRPRTRRRGSRLSIFRSPARIWRPAILSCPDAHGSMCFCGFIHEVVLEKYLCGHNNPRADCLDEKTCVIRCIMKEVRDATAKILDETTLDQLVAKEEQLSRPPALEYQI